MLIFTKAPELFMGKKGNITLTSQANDNRFLSPPDIPKLVPALPIFVLAHFARPIYQT